ncbi:hypothetical protein TWF730_003784 [Orbilia blumenaviensis]|uniref:Uncharacterized protein n=1 Tax=Orbilia blumenaviensis TaxID=1796055 RepID=A0AAV9U7K8_9PEZI
MAPQSSLALPMNDSGLGGFSIEELEDIFNSDGFEELAAATNGKLQFAIAEDSAKEPASRTNDRGFEESLRAMAPNTQEVDALFDDDEFDRLVDQEAKIPGVNAQYPRKPVTGEKMDEHATTTASKCTSDGVVKLEKTNGPVVPGKTIENAVTIVSECASGNSVKSEETGEHGIEREETAEPATGLDEPTSTPAQLTPLEFLASDVFLDLAQKHGLCRDDFVTFTAALKNFAIPQNSASKRKPRKSATAAPPKRLHSPKQTILEQVCKQGNGSPRLAGGRQPYGVDDPQIESSRAGERRSYKKGFTTGDKRSFKKASTAGKQPARR